MKQMQQSFKIDYWWECCQEIEIPKAHEVPLIKDAEERIFSEIKKGYIGGELHTNVRYGTDIVPEEDENDGLEYSGWWSKTKLEETD